MNGIGQYPITTLHNQAKPVGMFFLDVLSVSIPTVDFVYV